jgi:4-oxalocrotonate tautomerase
MPIIQVDMIEGRTVEQKRAMVEKVTQAMMETVGCQKASVKIIIRDVKEENISDGGILKYDA